MTVYATVTQLQAGWRSLTSAESAVATELLARASRKCRADVPDLDDRIADGIVEPGLAADVVCDMVRRAMAVAADLTGVSQVSETVGPFSQSVSYQNPGGDLYLTKAERRQLSGSRRAFSIGLVGQ